MNPVAWRAWFKGGARYDSRSSRWREIPDEGCLLFVVYMGEKTKMGGYPYRKIVSGGDWYWMDEGGMIHCSDTHDNMGQWVDPPEVDGLKRGIWTTDEEMTDVQSEATELRLNP